MGTSESSPTDAAALRHRGGGAPAGGLAGRGAHSDRVRPGLPAFDAEAFDHCEAGRAVCINRPDSAPVSSYETFGIGGKQATDDNDSKNGMGSSRKAPSLWKTPAF